MTETAFDAVVARFDPAHQERVRQLIGTDEELAGYWGRVEVQPNLASVPEELTRKCCTYKTCGNTNLELEVGGPLFRGKRRYTYRRASNGDVFFTGSREEAIEFVNDPWYFPLPA